jgi:hypothetical protein
MRIHLTIFTSILFFLIIACTGPSKKTESKNIYANNSDDRPYDDSALEDLHLRLKAGKDLPNTGIEELASYATTRGALYELLSQYQKEKFFPSKYYTFEKAAEGTLVDWLVYPTELDTVPSDIQLLKTVSFKENDTSFTYYVFKFKTNPPHWAAKNGWMLGVAGPYFPNSKPYDFVKGTFSRLNKVDSITPENEVRWVHENIYWTNPSK